MLLVLLVNDSAAVSFGPAPKCRLHSGHPLYGGAVSEAHAVEREEALARLSAEDRAWLEDRLVEYREVLQYLADH